MSNESHYIESFPRDLILCYNVAILGGILRCLKQIFNIPYNVIDFNFDKCKYLTNIFLEYLVYH